MGLPTDQVTQIQTLIHEPSKSIKLKCMVPDTEGLSSTFSEGNKR
jgi:hypothetical protein